MTQQPAQQAPVAIPHPQEQGVQGLAQARRGMTVRQHLGGQHRRQGQGHQGGEGDGGGHGQGELGEEPAHIPLEKGDGDEHRHQDEGGGQDGEAHLTGATVGGHQPRLAVLDHAPVDVLQDDDGIVHHQADGQHQGQQGKDIDGEAQAPEGEEGGDEGNGHHHRRHQGGAAVAQKEVDHQHHQDDGQTQGLVDLMHGAAHEDRGVVALVEFHALRQGEVEARRLRLGPLRHRQGVGRGLLDDADAHHGLAVAAEGEAVLVRAQFHPRHVPQAHQVTAIPPGQGQTGEVLGGIEGALGAHAELALMGLDTPRRQLQVLGAQGRLHVRHRQAPRRQGLPVEPDAQGEGLAAADPDPGHAVDDREAVHQIAAGEVADLRDGQAVAGQVEPEDDVLIGVHLLDLRRLGLFRQIVDHPRHPVAHVIGGGIDVAADVELDGDVGAPVLAQGFDVVDALHPRHPILDEAGDAGLHHVGGGAGVAGLHRDHRRVDIRVFPQGQPVEGQQAEGDEQQGNDRGQDRALDGDIGEDHVRITRTRLACPGDVRLTVMRRRATSLKMKAFAVTFTLMGGRSTRLGEFTWRIMGRNPAIPSGSGCHRPRPGPGPPGRAEPCRCRG